MARADPSPEPATDTAPPDTAQCRLRCMVGDRTHYTEWTTELPTIENYYEQYRYRDCTHDVAIERRAVLKG
ncbi:hypothetical protein [Haloarcula argentinensis]|uniref:Uncharacterized protein n=1 Tax=Haloarcula argentinensis TaxID=43776 RepID=A0A830FWZ6_HALAR|nr:hypothetical protein [Haloarcula argentinensis]GGM50762.1 hypothetical protein GCM10009006_34870 [Haloarcula argentinensis]